jgi:DNA recombination protein RmuC
LNYLNQLNKRLVKEFENTADKIFKEKIGEMSAQNKSLLDTLLLRLKNQIGDFSKQVNDVYTNEAKERHALKQEVHNLKELNEQMGKDATALTKALKGDNKKQGTWGEVVLERVLQESGLRLNHEYDTQVTLKDENGSSFKPDVIVHLPGKKDVVIDSKMALTAYERYYNADDEVTCQQALKEHINSIKNHIKQLTSKNYHDLHGIKSLDYTLMFIPVEPAFNVAIEHDNELIQLALEKNIMLVSPTNLMVALKTINNMWRVEYQNQNAQDIANKAGAIYDKLVGFVDDMKKLGNHLERAEGSYGDAMKKLSEGRGNLIRKAEDMKGLRISNNKSLPMELIEKSEIKNLVVNG